MLISLGLVSSRETDYTRLCILRPSLASADAMGRSVYMYVTSRWGVGGRVGGGGTLANDGRGGGGVGVSKLVTHRAYSVKSSPSQ